LAHIFPTYFPWLLVQNKGKEKKETKKKFQAQALACLISIVLSFVFALYH
jgi:hypothetical protein